MRLANGAGIKLHQFYHRVGKFALIKHQRYQAIQARQQGLILAASFAKSRVAMKKVKYCRVIIVLTVFSGAGCSHFAGVARRENH